MSFCLVLGAVVTAGPVAAASSTPDESPAATFQGQPESIEINGRRYLLRRFADSQQVALDDEIFGNFQAAELVAEARGGHRFDRDRAIALHERAIALQPGAKINAALADRIAQMYAFNDDPARGIRVDPSKAATWWRRCVQMTNPRQLLWAQAQMGLGGGCIVGRDFQGAVARYGQILQLDPDAMELPDWKVRPAPDTEAGRAALETERRRLREAVEGIQRRALEKVHYVATRRGGAAAGLNALRGIAREHRGTPLGDYAGKMIMKAVGAQQDALDKLPESLADLTETASSPPVAEPDPRKNERPRPVGIIEPKIDLGPAPAGGSYRWITVGVILGVGILVGIVVWLGRRVLAAGRRGLR